MGGVHKAPKGFTLGMMGRALCIQLSMVVHGFISFIPFALYIAINYDWVLLNTSGEVAHNILIFIGVVGFFQICIVFYDHIDLAKVTQDTDICCNAGPHYVLIFFTILQGVAVYSAIWQTHNFIFLALIIWSLFALVWCSYLVNIFGCYCKFHQQVPTIFLTYGQQSNSYLQFTKFTEKMIRQDFPNLPKGDILIKQIEINITTKERETTITIVKGDDIVYLPNEDSYLATMEELTEEEKMLFLEQKKSLKKGENTVVISQKVTLTETEWTLAVDKAITKNFKVTGMH